jgi:hypothetical protein
MAVLPHGRMLAAGYEQVSEAVEAGQPVSFCGGPAALARLVGRWEGVQGGMAAQSGDQADPIGQPQRAMASVGGVGDRVDLPVTAA